MELSIERSLREYAASSASLASIDPVAMEALGVLPGGLVRLSTFYQEILARVDRPVEEDRGTGRIRLDRFQRQSLRAKIHGEIEVTKEKERPTAKVRIQPSVDLGSADAHHLEDHLKQEMMEKRCPVTVGALLFLHFHHSVSGTLYKIVEVEGGHGIVTADTEVVLDDAPDGFSAALGLDLTFDDLGGLDREIAMIKELVQLPLKFPAVYRQIGIAPIRGLILYGPPGTGKTLLARATASELDAQFYYINGPEIIGGTYGESEGNLRRIFGEAIHHSPSVIFIDEIDAIAIKRGESGSHSDTRLVTQLLSLMDGVNRVDGVVVMGTTNRLDVLDVALRRPGRFDHELYIGAPDKTGRQQILDIHTRDMPLDAQARAYLPQLAQETSGFVGADLMALCRQAGLNALRRQSPENHAKSHDHDHGHGHDHHHDHGHSRGRRGLHWHLEDLRVNVSDLQAARRECRPSAARGSLVVDADQGFDRVGGLVAAKAQLRGALIEPLAAGTPPEGVLLYGPPGTGKSLLARAAAKEAGASLLQVNGPELFSKWLGETEEAVRHVFKLARNLAPAVIFFDQLDAIAPVRGRGTGSWSTERVVHQLLAELDSLEGAGGIAVIAATNRPDLVDEALLQPGRFGLRVELPLPDRAERMAVLRVHLAGSPAADGADALAGQMEGASGAQLRALAEYAKRHAAAGESWEDLARRWRKREK